MHGNEEIKLTRWRNSILGTKVYVSSNVPVLLYITLQLDCKGVWSYSWQIRPVNSYKERKMEGVPLGFHYPRTQQPSVWFKTKTWKLCTLQKTVLKQKPLITIV